ncbi:MAG: hypothetical protein ACLTNY_00140 [Blautia massiliensis (ex Durand et al. 2017)]
MARDHEAEGEKLAAEIETLNAEIARLTDASSASGARKDTLKAELAGLTARRTSAGGAAAAQLPKQPPAPAARSVQESTAQRDEASRIWTTPSSTAGCWKKTRSSWQMSVPAWSSS